MPKHPLSGKFFHTFDERGYTVWKGRVLEAYYDMAYVQLYSWVTGEESEKLLVSVQEFVSQPNGLRRACFYDTKEEWRSAYEHRHEPHDRRVDAEEQSLSVDQRTDQGTGHDHSSVGGAGTA